MKLLRRDVCCEQATSGLPQWDTSLLMRKETKKCPISTSRRVLALRPPPSAFISAAPPADDSKQPHTASKDLKQTLPCASCSRPQFLGKRTGRIPADTSAFLDKDQLQGSCCLAVLQPAQAASKQFERDCARQNCMTRSDDWSIFYHVDEQRALASLPRRTGWGYPNYDNHNATSMTTNNLYHFSYMSCRPYGAIPVI